MGNSANVGALEPLCCTSDGEDVPEDMITADLAQALFLHEVPVHVNATMEDEVKQASKKLKAVRMKNKADEAKKGGKGRRQLLLAVQQDDAPMVLQFIADGVAASDLGEALRLAAGRGSASVVRELVAVGLSVNEGCEGTGYTPLQLAAAGGHVVVCELLLDALADVHRQVEGINALSLARKMGNVEVEEVIERHVAALAMQDQANPADEAAQYRRAHVLPRVSAVLSEAVLQAVPFEDGSAREESSVVYEEDTELISNNTTHVIAEIKTEEQEPASQDAAGASSPAGASGGQGQSSQSSKAAKGSGEPDEVMPL
eukprot:TRINITY_DN78641_c0_g1_i1.p1 TRINITY_DN78641_c0_g1~~TRINITY_DN78641_c0_g1_i1.p1  ORF type:complete len:315 (+),score=80.47 TRINITY_DN78641_c0_g1_i1:70-1014(+)